MTSTVLLGSGAEAAEMSLSASVAGDGSSNTRTTIDPEEPSCCWKEEEAVGGSSSAAPVSMKGTSLVSTLASLLPRFLVESSAVLSCTIISVTSLSFCGSADVLDGISMGTTGSADGDVGESSAGFSSTEASSAAKLEEAVRGERTTTYGRSRPVPLRAT